jgi:hypothetical protein
MIMRRNSFPMFSPFAGWLALAVKTSEMLLASGHVIGHRVGRMAAAGPNPNAADRKEFTLMGSEKVAAAGESSNAMMRHMMDDNFRLARQMWSAQMGIISAFASLTQSRTPGEALARHGRLTQAANRQATAAFSNSAAKLMQTGLAPIHAAAVANSRRLKKR